MSSHLLPDGIVLRPARKADAEAMAELINAVEGPLGDNTETSANDDDRLIADMSVHLDVQDADLACGPG